MKNIIGLFGLCLLFSCKTEFKDDAGKKDHSNQNMTATERVLAQNSEQEVSCKLTPVELQKRKETVLANLKSKVLEKKELPNGYAFKFEGSDTTLDELIEFVKSERSCCNFFVFTLSFSGDGKEAWLTLTGNETAKEMISAELGL